jgi:hypothetical protein
MPAGPRFDPIYETIRESVTGEFIRIARRPFEYKAGCVEYFDSPGFDCRGILALWLERKNVSNVVIHFDPYREFGDDTLVSAANVITDNEKGKVEIYGPLNAGIRALRVQYDGGWGPVASGSDVMDCPATLKRAAIEECVFRANKLINNRDGKAGDTNNRAQKVQPEPLIDGVLPTTYRALQVFRRSLGKAL